MPPTRPESCTTIAYYDRDDRLSCVLPSPALLGSRVQRSSTETITPRPGRHDEPSALPTSCVAAANGRFAAITDWSVTVGPGCRGPHGALKLPAFAATPRERDPSARSCDSQLAGSRSKRPSTPSSSAMASLPPPGGATAPPSSVAPPHSSPLDLAASPRAKPVTDQPRRWAACEGAGGWGACWKLAGRSQRLRRQ